VLDLLDVVLHLFLDVPEELEASVGRVGGLEGLEERRLDGRVTLVQKRHSELDGLHENVGWKTIIEKNKQIKMSLRSSLLDETRSMTRSDTPHWSSSSWIVFIWSDQVMRDRPKYLSYQVE